MPRSELTTIPEILDFMLAGNATMTIEFQGKHYTYKVKQAKPRDNQSANAPLRWWVDLLTGPDNTSDYNPAGMLVQPKHGTLTFATHKGVRLPAHSAPVVWFSRFIKALVAEDEKRLARASILHEGRCGKCNRKLTDPTSIRIGLGPVCRGDQ
jgi:hypothetical protein